MSSLPLSFVRPDTNLRVFAPLPPGASDPAPPGSESLAAYPSTDPRNYAVSLAGKRRRADWKKPK